MPLLKGGIKHRQGRKPRGTRVKKIIVGKRIGFGTEGDINEIEVILEKRGRKTGELRRKKITMAQKEFLMGTLSQVRPPLKIEEGWLARLRKKQPELGNPVTQFNAMHKLIRLNRAKKLGLRIVPTIRIVKRKGKLPLLILTKLNYPDLTQQQREQYWADLKRQCKILESSGYLPHDDFFIPHVDKKTGNCCAVITDFGNVHRIRK